MHIALPNAHSLTKCTMFVTEVLYMYYILPVICVTAIREEICEIEEGKYDKDNNVLQVK